jgi:lantibiotic biosynthesis protein
VTGPPDSSTCLSVAERLGDQIVADAVWHGDRCNWVGALPEEGQGGRITLTYRALGADLYGGSAGVGLFLAELARITADASHRAAALGALRHATSRVMDIAPSAELGLYAGRPGVALALALAGRALDEPALDDDARAIADTLPTLASPQESDLISGSAGAIVGLLALRTLLDDDRLLDCAVDHGDMLLARGQRDSGRMSWLSPSLPEAPGLTGFSHGAAGIAVALLELSAATDTERYAIGADAAFAYERRLYDPGVANWPDLRGIGPSSTLDGPPFATFWCHGAPGGALGRLRALELGADRSLLDEARAGLETTERWLTNAVESGAYNYSVCHGVAGNAEVLLEGAAASASPAERAHEAARAGIDAYHRTGAAWPSGAQGGRTPGLFLGLAGIGRFYLRLAEPSLPSLLVLRPEQCPAYAVRTSRSPSV